MANDAQRCPDGGTCHHECQPIECFRVHNAGPLSGWLDENAIQDEDWPEDIKNAYKDPADRIAQEMHEEQLRAEVSQLRYTLMDIEQLTPGVVDCRFDTVVTGSGSMLLHGIDRHKQIGDIDLFARSEVWINLLQSGEWMVYSPSKMDEKRAHDPPYLYRKFQWGVGGIDTMEVNIFMQWRERGFGDINIRKLFKEAHEIDRMLCCSMAWLLDWKREVRRDKDLPDIDLIEEFINNGEQR